MCCQSIHGGHLHALTAEVYPEDPARYCNCQGSTIVDDPYACGCSPQPQGCCAAATGDDGKCDRCREHCKTETETTDEPITVAEQLEPAHA